MSPPLKPFVPPTYDQPRAVRRAALKLLRHNTVLYHAEMDRVRALVAARNAKHSSRADALIAAALVPVGLVPGIRIGGKTVKVRFVGDQATLEVA